MQFLPTFALNAAGESGGKSTQGSSSVRTSQAFSHILAHAAAVSQEHSQSGALLESKAQALAAESGDTAALARKTAAGSDRKASAAGRRKVLSLSSSTAPASFTAFSASGSTEAGASAAASGKSSVESKLRSLLSLRDNGAGVGRSLQNLTVSREDFAALREGLAQYGFSSDELDELKEMVNSAGGLSWGRLLSAASRKMAGLDAFPTELSQNETLSLQGFLAKLGSTPQEAEELADKLRRGDTAAVWQALQTKLAAQPEGAELDLDQDEIAALSKALGLTSAQQGRLGSSLGEGGAARLSVKDFSAVLSEIKTDAATVAEDRSSQATALRDLVAGAFAAARGKAGVSAAADRRPDDGARRARVLAEAAADERTAAKNEHHPLSGKSADQDGEGQGWSSRLPGTGRSQVAEETAARGADDRERGLDDHRRQGREAKAGDGSGTDTAKAAARTEDEKARASLLSKISREDAGAATKNATAKDASGLAGETAVLRAEVQQASTGSGGSGLEKFASRDVLRQVESGVYRNLSEGTKQLSLRLDPPELGKLNLQLTLRGQDVSVVFKAETADAGRMLQENLGHLRQVLEAQGLKVSKLEVQTQLAGGGQDSAWSGAERHNDAREQGETARALDRMRLLRGSGETVREAQTGDAVARRTHTGLSIVA